MKGIGAPSVDIWGLADVRHGSACAPLVGQILVDGGKRQGKPSGSARKNSLADPASTLSQ